ncbi:MAG: ShlB/FhaC/HecB family hemolysin secretion/activation protein, partial [Betaproteobacteria bacterium]|nr:ShlB/FhaC/HecB family hemolysin secretion/activation protein [Betaproteobacteria bacterium]
MARSASVAHIAATRSTPDTRTRSGQTGVVYIIGFVLEGDDTISDAEFSAAVAPFISRPLNYAELLAAAQAVAWAYRQAGWVVSATLPEQDVSDGIVRIAVNRAVLGGVEVTGPQASDTRATVVQGYVTAQQAPGQPLRVQPLDRAILLLNDLPGVSASGALREGQRVGETNFVVNLAPSVNQYGDVSFDNSGTRPSGSLRVLGNWYRAGLLRWGDQLSVNLIHSFTDSQTDGSDYQRFVYSL